MLVIIDLLLNFSNRVIGIISLEGFFQVLSLLHQGLSEPEFYGDLVYKFKKIRDMTDFLISLENYNALQTYWL